MARAKATGEAAIAARELASRQAIQEGLWALDSFAERWAELGFELLGISIRPPRSAGDDWLVTVKAVVMGERKVAFESGNTAEEVFRRSLAKVMNGSLQWREDKWAHGEGK